MDKIYELINLYLEDEIRISLHELAQVYNTTVENLKNICLKLSIGMITEDNYIYVNKVTAEHEDTFSLLETYVTNKDIEERMLQFLKYNQPCTLTELYTGLGLAREPSRRVLDELTFKDGDIWSDVIGVTELVYYGLEKYVEEI